jgi:predicted acyltransferase
MLHENPQRVRSIDALRGFDMFWLAGGEAIVAESSKLVRNPRFDAVAVQFTEHVEWTGFRFYDLIFPLFLFTIGATIPFALSRRLAETDRRATLIKVARRTAILFFLGLVYNGLLHFDGWEHLRPFGVLQRLAFGYAAASLLFIYTKPRTQVALFVAILLLTWAVYSFSPLTEWGNVANAFDRWLLPKGQMYERYGDPEGPLSTIPAIATAILGLLAGTWLRSEKTPERKALGLVLAGAGCLTLGLLWSPFFPIIKKIWTSSYVLVAGGCSLLLLALFYYLIDVRGWTKWSFPFVVIGSNAILIYILPLFVDFGGISRNLLGGALAGHKAYEGLGLAIGTMLIVWLFLYLLYRQKIFLRV